MPTFACSAISSNNMFDHVTLARHEAIVYFTNTHARNLHGSRGRLGGFCDERNVFYPSMVYFVTAATICILTRIPTAPVFYFE